jgi:D-alanyl-D-alanine carboxypeptidase
MNGSSSKNATRRRLARVAVPVVAAAIGITAVAVPAQAASLQAANLQAANLETGSTPVSAQAVSDAGATWSQVMRRKLDLSAESVRLGVLLPTLRTAVVARNADLVTARATLATATTTLAAATTANQAAHTRYMAARTAVGVAKKAFLAEQKRKPSNAGRIAAAKKSFAAATTTLKAWAVETGQAAGALTTARTGYATATTRVAAATTASQAAIDAVGDTQLKITATPAQVSALAARATAISAKVVTQSRAAFTTANTTQVYGVTVNKIVAYPFQHMIDDAAAAGVQLSGGGFRTRQQQIALRTTNGCPDVWTAPASSCRVPTAIPGRSLHELGLAIDMTSAKKTISSRTSPAYKWLAANAGRYGFVNLPSEPWHWSITGN